MQTDPFQSQVRVMVQHENKTLIDVSIWWLILKVLYEHGPRFNYPPESLRLFTKSIKSDGSSMLRQVPYPLAVDLVETIAEPVYIEPMKTDKDFLIWVWLRLQNVYGESPNADWMLRLRKIIDGMNDPIH